MLLSVVASFYFGQSAEYHFSLLFESNVFVYFEGCDVDPGNGIL